MDKGVIVSTSADLQELLNIKCDELAAAANMFRTILPHSSKAASVHHGEEGRFAEGLLAEFLRTSLPARLSVGTGFVVNLDHGLSSHQTDILVYDASQYAPYLRYGDAVVVPAESVVGAVSVKKCLQYSDVDDEAKKLGGIGAMCGGYKVAPPYLCLFAFEAGVPANPKKPAATSFGHLQSAYPARKAGYAANELIDAVVVLNQFYLRKTSWVAPASGAQRTQASYVWSGANKQHRNAYLQELLHGIQGRLDTRRTGVSPLQNTAHFASKGMSPLGSIAVKCDNRPPR
jgi:hypothetical protein